jgi:hypothetical protein
MFVTCLFLLCRKTFCFSSVLHVCHMHGFTLYYRVKYISVMCLYSMSVTGLYFPCKTYDRNPLFWVGSPDMAQVCISLVKHMTEIICFCLYLRYVTGLCYLCKTYFCDYLLCVCSPGMLRISLVTPMSVIMWSVSDPRYGTFLDSQ